MYKLELCDWSTLDEDGAVAHGEKRKRDQEDEGDDDEDDDWSTALWSQAAVSQN